MRPLRGSVDPGLGPGSVGAALDVPHVIAICQACIQSSVNNLTDNMRSIISAEGRHALVRRLFFFPPLSPS